MDNQTATLVLIAIAVPVALIIYLSYTHNKTHKKYINNGKELIKVKGELVETKVELIRRTEEKQELIIENKYLGVTCQKIKQRFDKQNLKLYNVLEDIQSIGRRISIKELEAFKQRCADIYNDIES